MRRRNLFLFAALLPVEATTASCVEETRAYRRCLDTELSERDERRCRSCLQSHGDSLGYLPACSDLEETFCEIPQRCGCSACIQEVNALNECLFAPCTHEMLCIKETPSTEGGLKCDKDEFSTCARRCADGCLDEDFGNRRLTSDGGFSFPIRLLTLEDVSVTPYAGVDSCQMRVQEYQACLSRVDKTTANNCIDCRDARVPENAEFCYELWDLFCVSPNECCGSCQDEIQNVLECYYEPCESDVTCALLEGGNGFPPLPSCAWDNIEECIDLECVSPVFESSQQPFSPESFVDCVTKCADACLADGRRLHATSGNLFPSFRALALSDSITPYQGGVGGVGGGFCQSKTNSYLACLSEQGKTNADLCIRCLNGRFPENPVYCDDLLDLVCDAPRECGCDPCDFEISGALECYFPPCKDFCSSASFDPPRCQSQKELNSCIENCLEPCLQPIEGSGW